MPKTKTAAPVLQHRNGQTKKNHHLYSTPHCPHLQGFRQFHANGLRAGRAVRRGRPGPGRRGGCNGRAGLLPAGRVGFNRTAGGGNMRGIVIDPGAKPELYRLPDTLQELQRFMGGYAQRCPINNKFAALFYLPQAGQSLPTRHYKGRWFYGRLCLVGWRGGRMTDLPKPLAEELLQKFTPVEVTP